MNNAFKYISLEDLQKETSPIVYLVSEEQVQEFCEANYGRRLTEKEAAELFNGFCEDEHGYLYNLMDSAVEYVLGEEQARKLWAEAHKDMKLTSAFPSSVPIDANNPLLELPLTVVCRDIVQTYAIAKYGRPLTDEEMKSLVQNLKDAAALRLPSEIERQMQWTDYKQDNE